MKQINFLRNQQDKLKLKNQKRFIVQISALAVLVIYGLMVIVVFSYYFVLGRQAQNLSQKIDFQKTKIEGFVGIETKQFYIKQKAKNLNTIMQSARNHQAVVEGLFSILPPEVEINGFNVTDEGVITLSGRALTFTGIKTLIERIGQGAMASQKIYSASADGISLGKKGDFTFNVTMRITPVKIESENSPNIPDESVPVGI